ncbi:hypothetical protein M569_01860, partial [Genlisea aurea]
MALWMDPSAQPATDQEIVDVQAITAIKESSAIELKDKGNEYVKRGKKHYPDAVDCYTRAINQKVLSDSENSVLYSNRAHVNLLLGNFRRAFQDSQEAIRLCPTNIKAIYRAAKAALSLNLIDDAKSYCDRGLQQSPENEELKKIARLINSKILESQQREVKVSNSLRAAEELVSALGDRKIKMGKPMYQELTGTKKPVLDNNSIIHWPVLLLYPEVMSSDFIEDFCEADMFSLHLDMMFSDTSPPLPWDSENVYTRNELELYYEVYPAMELSKREIFSYLLQGTTASHLQNF